MRADTARREEFLSTLADWLPNCGQTHAALDRLLDDRALLAPIVAACGAELPV